MPFISHAAGVPSEVSVDTWDGESVLFDDDLYRLGLITEYEHPILGRVRQFGNLITFSAIRRSAVIDNAPPPVEPDARLPLVPPPLPGATAAGA